MKKAAYSRNTELTEAFLGAACVTLFCFMF